MIKLIIFDWDDVITLGAKEAYFTCYHTVMTALGIHLEPQEERQRILSKWGKPYREEFKELLREHPELVDKACELYKKKKDVIFLKSLSIHKKTNAVLRQLDKHFILAVASGNTPEMIKDVIMPHFHIPQVFSQFVSSHDIRDPVKMKPHPYMLQIIMKKQNAAPDETVYVGDARTDFQMAKRAGVIPIVVLTGHLTKSEAMKLGATWIIPDVTHLPQTLTLLQSRN